ncbi:hypothetical protein Leryth_026653 [Lithospermum erythrorhizon]|nr:hypothetical protein Leryth_026653 [Lithospermum erythrorhizon]
MLLPSPPSMIKKTHKWTMIQSHNYDAMEEHLIDQDSNMFAIEGLFTDMGKDEFCGGRNQIVDEETFVLNILLIPALVCPVVFILLYMVNYLAQSSIVEISF